MDTLDPALRKANLRLLIGLIIFAIALCALCILWMHRRSEKDYQEQFKGTSFYEFRGGHLLVYPSVTVSLGHRLGFAAPLSQARLFRASV